jgi:hypothetical protein
MNLSLFIRDITGQVENANEFVNNLLEMLSEFSQIAEYRTNTQE